ncbi:MAG: hypothetical protein A3G34_17205 [Candidatus Lindowbacteria bacterium RIFCSPLOWO2_12_FULL_62_27]|nr:MAG: hypothetical protein A3G34_17205 [Candidatus Lindowbacteria bacterium RIFCSPLOWO2_12_FULL_62_27]OGH63989.1 MAG: hypothetical protein A3I06_10560 [Candidatus Lindowbacteria bacterium RIFCSPLOWO2_02_FULL_62_12]
MNRDTGRLRSESFDLLVIGGGILGAGVARDAALRGLRVALVDQGDFGSGTSSRSSKLVHGGLRYLEHAEFRLVAEACRERDILLRIAPHLVEPLPVLFPCWRGFGRPLWKIRLGLVLYDFLAGPRVIQRHRMLWPESLRALEPAVNQDRLEGAGLYYDCRMNDARLCLENVIAAVQAGVAAANYVRVAGLEKSKGCVTGARCEDLETAQEFFVRASVTVNATGPWADAIRALDDPGGPPTVRRTRGIHLITGALLRSHGLTWTARSDGRVLFLLPFGSRHSLIGTTDTDSGEDPAEPRIEPEDVSYLLSEVSEVLSGVSLSTSDVTGAFAGIRTLLRNDGGPSSVSREYRILESRSGLISVIGGKYTTYRAMADRVVRQVFRRLRRPIPPGQTERPLPGVARQEDRRTQTGEIVSGSGVCWEDVSRALDHEMARRPMDFLRRRTNLGLICRPDEGILANMAGIFAKRLGWDPEKTIRETHQARIEWSRHHPA